MDEQERKPPDEQGPVEDQTTSDGAAVEDTSGGIAEDDADGDKTGNGDEADAAGDDSGNGEAGAE